MFQPYYFGSTCLNCHFCFTHVPLTVTDYTSKTLMHWNIYLLFPCSCRFSHFAAVPSGIMDRGFVVIVKDQVPVASPVSCTMTTGSNWLDLTLSFENKTEPFAHIFSSRLPKPCIAHPHLPASQMRQYGTPDTSLVVICKFNVGKGMRGWYRNWIIQP